MSRLSRLLQSREEKFQAVQNLPRLPDGRYVRILEGTYTQTQMFGLKIPAHESIMTVKEYDALLVPEVVQAITAHSNWIRTREYAFYPKGFERQDLPMGDKIIYVETGVAYTFIVPDVSVNVNGTSVGLRTAIGMGVIPIEKLRLEQVDETHFTVLVTSDFNPASDVKVVDIMRPSGVWALVDADGYPIRARPSDFFIPEARCSYVRNFNEFEKNATGWHGSLVRYVFDIQYVFDIYYRRRDVSAYGRHVDAYGVAVVSRAASHAPPGTYSISKTAFEGGELSRVDGGALSTCPQE